MYSRNARNVRTKMTCKRHIFAPPPQPPSSPPEGESNASAMRNGNIARRWIHRVSNEFRRIVGAICMVIFRDYASPNLWRFVANIGSVTREELRTTENDAITPAIARRWKCWFCCSPLCIDIFTRYSVKQVSRRHLIFRKHLSTLGKMMPRGNKDGVS